MPAPAFCIKLFSSKINYRFLHCAAEHPYDELLARSCIAHKLYLISPSPALGTRLFSSVTYACSTLPAMPLHGFCLKPLLACSTFAASLQAQGSSSPGLHFGFVKTILPKPILYATVYSMHKIDAAVVDFAGSISGLHFQGHLCTLTRCLVRY